jgi:hypothetical protein
MHKVASKLAPTGTEWFWLLWERARTRQLRTKSRASSLPQVPSGFGCCGSVLARDSFMHKVASKLAPTGTEWFWLLWERARTRQLHASRREQARSHRYRVVLAVVGACSHATASCTKSRASSLPQVPSGFGCCGSVLARDSFMHKVASKLAPTGTEWFWLLWERARTRQLHAQSREQARSYRSCRASRREQARSHRYRAVLAVVGACSHATASCTKSRASSLLQELSGIASRASSLPRVKR